MSGAWGDDMVEMLYPEGATEESPPTDDTRERLARAAYPEWFGKSGKILANYPGQDKNYQEMALKKVDAILAEQEAIKREKTGR